MTAHNATTLWDSDGLVTIENAGFGAVRNGGREASIVIETIRGPNPPIQMTLPFLTHADPVPNFCIGETGSLTIRFVDDQGLSVAGVQVDVWKDYVSEGVHDQISIAGKDRSIADATGVIHLQHVGLGLTLRIHAVKHGLRSVHEIVVGPVIKSSTVDARVVLAERVPVVKSRFIQQSGKPLQRHSVVFTILVDGVQVSAKSAMTDDDGFIELPIPWALREGEIRCEFEVADRSGLGLTSQDRNSVVLGRAPRLDQTIDIGTIRVTAPEIQTIASGRVVDRSGKAVSGACIRLLKRGVRSISDNDQRVWMSDGREIVTSDATGRFSIGSYGGDFEYRVSADGPGLVTSGPQDVRPGKTDHLIVVDRAALVAGRVILPNGWSLNHFSIRISSKPSLHFPHGWATNVDCKTSDCFRSEIVPESVGAIEFCVFSGRFLVHAVNEVAFHANQVTRDPRLDAIDIQQSCHLVQIRVSDQDGSPLTSFRVTADMSDLGGNESEEIQFKDGEENLAYVAVPRGRPRTLRVCAAGYLPKSLQLTDGIHEVTLNRGIPIVLEITNLPLIPNPKSVEFEFALNRRNDTETPGEGLKFSTSFTEASGNRRELVVIHAGEYEISRVLLLEEGEGSAPGKPAIRVIPLVGVLVRINESDENQVVQVTLDDAGLSTLRELTEASRR